MDEMEDKIGAILNNPQMMQQIMAMAQSFGSQEAPPSPPPQDTPDIDLAAVQKLTGLMGKAGMDSEQKALLSALSPYISAGRIHKLEKAMRAAKLAGIATSFLGNTPLFSGR